MITKRSKVYFCPRRRKGQRLCFFFGAILSPNENVALEERKEADSSSFICKDVFQGGKKQTVDYHGMFDSKYFEDWMIRLGLFENVSCFYFPKTKLILLVLRAELSVSS